MFSAFKLIGIANTITSMAAGHYFIVLLRLGQLNDSCVSVLQPFSLKKTVYRLSHYFVDRLRRGTIERFMRLCFGALDFDVA